MYIIQNVFRMKKSIKKKSLSTNMKIRKKSNKSNPYVIYKLDGQNRFSFLISKYADLEKSDDMFSSVFKQIRINGSQIISTRLESLGKGKILYKSKDGLYAIYKENKTNSIYVLMYIDYGDISYWLHYKYATKKRG